MLFYLAGLTCNEETFAIKAGAQKMAAELGLMLVTPDTSPRNTGVSEADLAWDFGTAASFYLDAQQAPWNKHWRMASYINEELRALVFAKFNASATQVGIFGHSMGGHGALTLALRSPGLYQSVSAFAPICAPTQCPWGTKAFNGYFGDQPALWQQHDATALIKSGARLPALLIDQGMNDKFFAEQLNVDLFEQTCQQVGQALTLRRHVGYDHGYYFIATYINDHLKHHATVLSAAAP